MNKESLQEYLAKRDEEDLRKCFEEYEELNRTGILKDGIARKIEKWYKERYSIIGSVLETVRNAIYYEMAMRFYDQL